MDATNPLPAGRLYGQETAYHLLESWFEQNSFPHALLIEGESGSGRRTLAAYAVAMLLCRKENPPCENCPSCQKMKSGSHPDRLVIAPENDKKSIGVDQIRKLRGIANFAPHEALRRVCLICDAELMTTEAQNALLKLMEEPPPSLTLICTVRSREALLETLTSRMTPLRMQGLKPEAIAAVLRAKTHGVDESLLVEAAHNAATVGQALSLLKDETLRRHAEDARHLFSFAQSKNRYALLKLLSGWEKDRAAYVFLFEAARRACLASLGKTDDPDDALRYCRLADIMEQSALAAGQNVGLPLLSAVVTGRLCALS